MFVLAFGLFQEVKIFLLQILYMFIDDFIFVSFYQFLKQVKGFLLFCQIILENKEHVLGGCNSIVTHFALGAFWDVLWTWRSSRYFYYLVDADKNHLDFLEVVLELGERALVEYLGVFVYVGSRENFRESLK